MGRTVVDVYLMVVLVVVIRVSDAVCDVADSMEPASGAFNPSYINFYF